MLRRYWLLLLPVKFMLFDGKGFSPILNRQRQRIGCSKRLF
jgi:hypothetical protein